MTRIPQSPQELDQHLKEQIAYLRNSAALYDGGDVREAKRLAVPIRVLVHDTQSSRSLLGQMSLKSIGFCDTAFPHSPENRLTHIGLVAMHLGSHGARYEAMLDNTPRGRGEAVSFDDWWNAVVFVDTDRNTMTRGDLVLAVADQDGGAHVDPALRAVYARLSRSNSLGWAFVKQGEVVPLDNPVPASIRQIAHELIKSVEVRQPYRTRGPWPGA